MSTSNNDHANRHVAGGTEPVSSLPSCGQCYNEHKEVPAVHAILVATTGEGEEIIVELCNDCGDEWRSIFEDCNDCSSLHNCHCLERRDVDGGN